jgi:7-cyano-7-deazaguanine synthase
MTWQYVPFLRRSRMQECDGVAVVSGGMDSSVMLHKLVHDGHKPLVIAFNYGQRHDKELIFAQKQALMVGRPFYIADMQFYGDLLWDIGSESSLVNHGLTVPEGHYAEDNMRNTNVPNRNSIMLNIATGLCVAVKGNYVATGVHAGDHFQYPDCRPQFIFETQAALKVANKGFLPDDFRIKAPWLNVPKDKILEELAYILHDRFSKFDEILRQTWSCYKGGDLHCGKCGTCVERAEAFYIAAYTDPTEYEDKDYWKTVTKLKVP